MPVAVQILAGSAMILICAANHILTAAAVTALSTGLEFLAFLLAHLIQIYLCALAFRAAGAPDGYAAPIYFSPVTYSTLSYGDVILTPDFRISGAMASVCGVLMFGLTTAFLVAMPSRLLRT